MFEALAPKIARDKRDGTQGISQDADPVFIYQDPVTFRVEGVDQLATVRDAVSRQLRESVARSHGDEVAPTGLGRGLDEDVVLDRLGGQPGFLPRQGREVFCQFLYYLRGSHDFYVICHCEKNPPSIQSL